ncbi:MAG: hypothetical protein IKH30_09075 [Clostridia bacterium]|nr:hypothetical protein [Clostridia bacterium]
MMGRIAHRDTSEAARSVSLLYLEELAGRREQVVEDNLNDSVNAVQIALGLMDENDLSDLDHLRSYQRKIKQLFSLERFAFVDEDGLVYTADDGIALSITVLGGLAAEDNLLEALSHADYEEGYSYDAVLRDFREGKRGVTAFSYHGVQETLSYVPMRVCRITISFSLTGRCRRWSAWKRRNRC